MNDITPQEWNSILEKIADYKLPQIVEISIDKLKEAREKYLKNEMKEINFISLTNDITNSTLELIKGEEMKKSPSSRKIALFLSALFSFILIGIPFFLKIRKEDKKLKTDICHFKQTILETCEANSYAILLKKLDHLPFILQDIQKQYTDHRRQELINAQMLADWRDGENIPLESRPLYDREFENDIQAGASFQRIDRASNIEDKERLPLLKLHTNSRVKEGAAFLKELIKKPEDQRWEMILQLAVTHASLFTAFKAVLAAFNVDAAKIQWEKNGKYYSIKSVFSDTFPPIILEIIRHSQYETIEKVIVTVRGSLDIVSYNTARHDDLRIIIPKAITEELHYSISFGEDNRPMISNLHSQMQANIYTQPS